MVNRRLIRVHFRALYNRLIPTLPGSFDIPEPKFVMASGGGKVKYGYRIAHLEDKELYSVTLTTVILSTKNILSMKKVERSVPY